MEAFLDILKYTIPGLIVFATAYFVLRQFIEYQQSVQRAALRQEAMKITLPVRLQAYERLTLLCDRADIRNTLLRIRMPGMTVGDLRGALLVAISQEFDHNTSQQLYVSDTLWRIINIAKTETLNQVAGIASDLKPEDDAQLLVNRLVALFEEQGFDSPLHKAIIAVRTEAGRLF